MNRMAGNLYKTYFAELFISLHQNICAAILSNWRKTFTKYCDHFLQGQPVNCIMSLKFA